MNPTAISKEKAKRSLAEFIKQAWHQLEPGQPYSHNWHIDATCEHLEAVTNNQITRLLINVPPGTMKSLMTSVFFPSWEWGAKGMQHLKYISTAHSQTLALRDNIKSRRLIGSQWYQDRWPITIMGDQNSKTKFENDQFGFREAMATSSVTGARGDRIIVDDPHSVEGASSDQKRQTTLEWFTEALPTRLINPKTSAIIVIMQRLHAEDISGYILAKELGYEHLMLPMEFDPTRKCYTSIGFEDPRTYEGELLFEERFPREVVERDKKIMGSLATAGQMQQSPAPAGGNIFREADFGWYKAYRQYDKITISWDTAFKASELNDPSVAIVWGHREGGFDILEVVRKRMKYPALKREAINLAEKYSEQKWYARQRLLTLLIEDKASGQSLIQDLKDGTNYNIVSILPENDKITRAATCSPQVEDGKVNLKADAPWVQDYIEEMTVFPNVSHDDQVDATSQFLNWVSTSSKGIITDLFFN